MENKIPFGQKVAEKITNVVGSWKFIIIQSIVLSLWVIANVTVMWLRWDPYPFILMNLFLSLQAAYTAPLILMAQNRVSEIDREILHNDFRVDQNSNKMIKYIHDHLEWQDDKVEAILTHLNIDTPPKPKPPVPNGMNGKSNGFNH